MRPFVVSTIGVSMVGKTFSEKRYDVNTKFENGVFQIDFGIRSEEEGDVFILLALRKAAHKYDHYICGIDPDFVVPSGFGDDVKVDGYQIRSYHQLFYYRKQYEISYWIDSYNACNCDYYRNHYDTPTKEFPVFVKKIRVPENASVREKINIHLPDTFTRCFGEIFLFRNSQAIEESMKTKLDPEMYKGDEIFEQYCTLFPDSTIFSYLIAEGLNNLSLDYCENNGWRELSDYYGEPYFAHRLACMGQGAPIAWVYVSRYDSHVAPETAFFYADRPRNHYEELVYEKYNPNDWIIP